MKRNVLHLFCTCCLLTQFTLLSPVWGRELPEPNNIRKRVCCDQLPFQETNYYQAQELGIRFQENADLMALVTDALGYFLNSRDFQVESIDRKSDEQGSSTFTGNMTVFQSPVRLAGTLGTTNDLEKLRLEFPEGATLNGTKLNKMVGGNLENILPEGIPLTSGLTINYLDLSFGASLGTLKALSAGLQTANWGMLGFGSFQVDQVGLEFEIQEPTKASRSVNGTISSNSTLGGMPISLSGSFSTNREEVSITASIEKLSMNSFFEAVGAKFVANSVPEELSSLELSALTASIRPFDKVLSGSATTSLGEASLYIEKSAELDLQIGLAPPANWRFSSLSSALSPMDAIDFAGTAMVISSKGGPLKNELSALEKVDAELVAGLNLFAGIDLPDDLSKLLKVDQLQVAGQVGKKLDVINLEAALQFDNLDLGGGVNFSKVGFGLEFNTRKPIPIFRLGGTINVQAGDDLLGLNAEFEINPAAVSLQGGFWLEALQQQGALLTAANKDEVPEWNNPFGVDGVAISRLGGSVGLSPSSPIILSSLGMIGKFRLGTVPDKAKHIYADLTAKVDIVDISRSILDVSIKNMTILAMIEAFSETDLDGVLETILDFGPDSARVKIVPVGQTYLGRYYDQGIAFDANLSLAGLNAEMNFAIGESGISARGAIDKFVIQDDNTNFKFFELTGVVGDQAEVEFAISDNPKFKVNGKVTIMEAMEASTFIEIDQTGFYANVRGNLGGGALKAEAIVQAKDLDKGGIRVYGKIEDQIMERLETALTNFIDESSKAVQSDIQTIQGYMSQTQGNEVEEAFESLFSGMLDGVKTIDKELASAGKAIIEMGLTEIINLDSMTFDFTLDDKKTKIYLQIAGVVAGQRFDESLQVDITVADIESFLESVVEELGDAVKQAFEDAFGEEFDAFVADAEAFFNDIAVFFEDVGAEFSNSINWIDQQFSCESVPVVWAGYRPSNLPDGYLEYNVAVTLITADRANDNNVTFDKDLEIYGSILGETIGSVRIGSNRAANQYFFNQSCDSYTEIEQGRSKFIWHQKQFYVKPGEERYAGLRLVAHLFDSDFLGHVEADRLNGSQQIMFGDTPLGQKRTYQLKASDASYDHAVTINIEVEAHVIKRNIALDRTVRASNPSPGRAPTNITDGDTEGIVFVSPTQKGYFSTESGHPYLQIDLGGEFEVQSVTVFDCLDFPRTNIQNTFVFYGIDPSFSGITDPSLAWEAGLQGGLVASTELGAISLGQYKDKYTFKAGANSKARYVRVWQKNPNAGVENATICTPEVEIDAIPSAQALSKAVAANNPASLRNLLSLGAQGDLNALLFQAVKKNNVQLLFPLVDGGAKVSSEMVDWAIANNGQKEVIDLLLYRGARPSSQSITRLIDKNDRQVLSLAMDKGLKPNQDHLFRAIQTGKTEIASDMVYRNTPVNPREVNEALVKGQLELVRLMLAKKANPGILSLNTAIQQQNEEMVGFFLLKVKPNDDVLLTAAQTNNVTIFARLIAADGFLTTNRAIDVAIDNNNPQILDLGLRHGGDATAAAAKAMQNNNNAMLYACLNQNANPNKVFDYAASRTDFDLFKSLISRYGGSGQEALRAAIQVNNSAFAEFPLQYTETEPSAFLAGLSTQGNVEMARLLINYGANPNEGIAEAVNGNFTELVRLYTEAGADVTKPSFQETAIANSNLEVMKLLLDEGANPNDGISKAILSNEVAIARLLLEAGAMSSNQIQHPASSNQMEMVQLLLDFGADPNPGLNGAINNRHNAILQVLLSAGASPFGQLPQLVEMENQEAIALFIGYGADPNKGMQKAVSMNNNAIVLLLLEADASPLGYIQTPASKGNTEMVEMLLERGADPERGIAQAVGGGHHTTANVLINNGADGSKDEFMLLAAQKSYSRLIPVLVAAGGNPNISDAQQQSLLHIAASKRENTATVRALVQAGALLDATNPMGDTPLHLAAKEGRKNRDTVAFLLEAGADCTLTNIRDETALDVAKAKKNKKALKDCMEE